MINCFDKLINWKKLYFDWIWSKAMNRPSLYKWPMTILPYQRPFLHLGLQWKVVFCLLEELFPFKNYSSPFINFTDNFKGLKAMSKIVCRTRLGNHMTRWFFIWYVMSINHTNYHIKSGYCILYEKKNDIDSTENV